MIEDVSPISKSWFHLLFVMTCLEDLPECSPALLFAKQLRELTSTFEMVLQENRLFRETLRTGDPSQHAQSFDDPIPCEVPRRTTKISSFFRYGDIDKTEEIDMQTASSEHVCFDQPDFIETPLDQNPTFDASISEASKVSHFDGLCDEHKTLPTEPPSLQAFEELMEGRDSVLEIEIPDSPSKKGNNCSFKASSNSNQSTTSPQDQLNSEEDHDNQSDRSNSKELSPSPVGKPRISRSKSNALLSQILSESKSEMQRAQMNWTARLRDATWSFWEKPDACMTNQVFHMAYNFIIVLSVCSPIAASTNISAEAKERLSNVDLGFTVVFSIELFLKLLSCPALPCYLKSVYTLIDLVVVIVGYINLAFDGSGSMILQLLRTQMPILRLLKITRHSSKWRLLLYAMRNCVAALLVPIYLLLLMVVFSGSLHFWIDQNFACISTSTQTCEKGTDPAFQSIPEAMWFVLVTIATVGYGDLVPHTVPGKILASMQIVMGVCYMAMPITIIGANFSKVWSERHQFLIRDKLTSSAVQVDVEKMRQVFELFDYEEQGALSEEAFVSFMDCFQLDISKTGIRELFNAIDVDGSKEISFDEFLEFVFPEQTAKQH